jgi:hypothetical protein
MSNTTNTGSDASSSDYQYWRSQHRPSDDGGVPREKIDVFYEAVCNRFGEEMGQRLDRLVWPEVPSKAKRVAGVVGGRLLSLFMAYEGARRTAKAAKAATNFVTTSRVDSRVECGQLQVTVDGRRVTVRFDGGLGRKLSDSLKACQSSWEVTPLFVEDHFVEMVFDDGSDNGSLVEWKDGETRCVRKGVSKADAFDHLVGFLREVYVAHVAEQMGIDQNRPSEEIGDEKLRKFLAASLCVALATDRGGVVDG